MKNIINKGIKYILNADYRFLINSSLGLYNKMSDVDYLKKKFKIVMGYELDLENPKRCNEKLQWLKLNNRKDIYTTMVDKYKVREYIKEQLGEEYLIPLIGVWDNPENIDFDKLPEKFVLKCNHNSGLGMCICKDKSKLDIAKVKENLKKGMKQNYYLTGREWPYKNVERKIICEKFMEDDKYKELRDYKFYCFNGKVEFAMINSDRFSKEETKADYFDKDYNWLDFTWGYKHAKEKPQKPEKFDEMWNIAEKLCKDLKHIRVDLYCVNNKIYFGELTFFDGSGFDKIEPIEWDYKIGDLIKLNN